MFENDIGGQFVWWIGVVESRQDPLKVGRCQVRIAGSHTSMKALMPTDDLPWAQPLIPLNDNASLQIKEGDMVMGFYLDGPQSQKPIIMGILPGIPVELNNTSIGFTDPRVGTDLSGAPKQPVSLVINSEGDGVTITEGTASRYPTRINEPTFSRLARNEKLTESPIQSKRDSVFKSIPKVGGGTFDEPVTPYAAVYPYNRVMETESGHIVEFDDTPGAERIHIYHRSGTFDEYHPNGDKVQRVNADSYEIVLADKHIYVNGDCHITAKKAINFKAGGDISFEADGDIRIKATGSILSQATVKQTHFSSGPMSLDGVPMNWNLPGKPPLGKPGEPITVSVNVTSQIAPDAITPDPNEEGNKVLAEKPGANVSDSPPNVLAVPVETPTDIPAPAVATAPASITSSEGGNQMIRAMNRAHLTDPTQRAAIYSQTEHESGGFKSLVESFKFSRENLLRTWSKYFNAENIDGYLRQDAKIASRVYGNRMGNSTEASQDGWEFRGRGFIQLTGKQNYLAVSRSLNQDFVSYPGSASSPSVASDIAVWYFLKGASGQGFRGNYGDIRSVTRYVNGGFNGLDDRTVRFEKAKTDIKVTTYNEVLV